MNITLKRTDEQVELVKAMASRDRTVAYEAQAALAEFMGPVLAEVVNQAPVVSNLFSSFSFNADSNPSLPLDLYYDINADDYIKVYSTTVPGGLPTNQVLPTASELKFTTYRLDSAVSFDRRYALQSRLDVIGKSMTRVAQEILLKQQSTSANLILGSLADAETNGEDLRAMSYNPVNTAQAASGTTSIAAPESFRSGVFSNGGVPELYGIGLMEINELGRSRKFCKLFQTFQAASAVPGAVGFGVNDDLVIGIDRSRESLIRAVATDSETGAEFTLIADDQYSNRQQKLGWFGSIEEGRMIVDNRVLTGVVVAGH